MARRTFNNCRFRKEMTRKNIFNDTELNEKGKCKGFKLPLDVIMMNCKCCRLWEGKDE